MGWTNPYKYPYKWVTGVIDNPTVLELFHLICGLLFNRWGAAQGTDHLRSTYDFEKVLGRGSVGIVYKATRRADERKVVVKVRNVIDDKAQQHTKKKSHWWDCWWLKSCTSW